MTPSLEGNQTEPVRRDFIESLVKKDSYFRIIIDGISEDEVKELFTILENYHKSKDWRNRINPSNITVEKYQSRELHKCGRDECLNLILSFDSFCSNYCVENYVSYDEDEMR